MLLNNQYYLHKVRILPPLYLFSQECHSIRFGISENTAASFVQVYKGTVWLDMKLQKKRYTGITRLQELAAGTCFWPKMQLVCYFTLKVMASRTGTGIRKPWKHPLMCEKLPFLHSIQAAEIIMNIFPCLLCEIKEWDEGKVAVYMLHAAGRSTEDEQSPLHNHHCRHIVNLRETDCYPSIGNHPSHKFMLFTVTVLPWFSAAIKLKKEFIYVMHVEKSVWSLSIFFITRVCERDKKHLKSSQVIILWQMEHHSSDWMHFPQL